MKISDSGEFGLISRIRALSHRHSPSLLLGIGDDAAALQISQAESMLVTTDLLLEGIHFDLATTDYCSLGWKSAAVNISDIAAMGGIPRYCFTALGIPKDIPRRSILDFYRGFNRMIRTERVVLAGGDTCASRKGLVISVTAIGESSTARIVTRSGARPGDHIFITGRLGDSAAGLEMLRMRNAGCGTRNKRLTTKSLQSACGRLVEKHLRPVPRVKEGRALALAGCASSMIDISDGLSSDLAHVCEESDVGAEVAAEKIPLSASLRSMAQLLAKPVLEYALHGGEDYELLFTVPENRLKKFSALGIPAFRIGTIIRGRRMYMTGAAHGRVELRAGGYDHFAPARKGKRA